MPRFTGNVPVNFSYDVRANPRYNVNSGIFRGMQHILTHYPTHFLTALKEPIHLNITDPEYDVLEKLGGPNNPNYEQHIPLISYKLAHLLGTHLLDYNSDKYHKAIIDDKYPTTTEQARVRYGIEDNSENNNTKEIYIRRLAELQTLYEDYLTKNHDSLDADNYYRLNTPEQRQAVHQNTSPGGAYWGRASHKMLNSFSGPSFSNYINTLPLLHVDPMLRDFTDVIRERLKEIGS